VRCIESSSFVCRRIWHLAKFLLTQVAGFHRAVPSTTLDKACMQLLDDYNRNSLFVKSFEPFVHNSGVDFSGKYC